MSVDLQVLEDPARACAALLLGPLLGEGHVVLTGGSTPARAYEELAQALQMTGRDVSGASVWFSDERCVPPDDALSNYALVKRTLLDRLEPAAAPQVWRIAGEAGPEEGATRYARELEEAGALPFELVLLGLGPDGHIASMFPDQEALLERDSLVVGVPHAGLEPLVPRVTLTLPALSTAERIVLLVTGESKANAVAAAFGPNAEPTPHVPGSMLAPLAAGEVTVLLDSAAAALL